MAKKIFTSETLTSLVNKLKEYSKSYTDQMTETAELITIDDIDTICGTTYQVANQEGVTF